MLRCRKSATRMISTTGATRATVGMRVPAPPATLRMISSDLETSMTTATGGKTQVTGIFGSQESKLVGLLITMGIGPGSIRGDGPGLTMLPGAMRRFIMAVGFQWEVDGAGSLGLVKSDRSTPPHWSRSWAEEVSV